MSEHKATIEWRRQGADFDYRTYSRSHTLAFEGGIQVPASAAPGNIPPTAKGAAGVDPEQAFVASISSCHMLWFLHLAWKAKLVVDHYVDHASGVLGKNAEGREAMTRVTLRPAVTFSGRKPTPEEHARLHEDAHHKCFIANSVKTEVTIEPGIA
ncbi:MAG: OsmC family protein [Betaproteobacteria bacterium]|nr:OsmC family protein [Betaproteobacteria bacterium]